MVAMGMKNYTLGSYVPFMTMKVEMEGLWSDAKKISEPPVGMAYYRNNHQRPLTRVPRVGQGTSINTSNMPEQGV